MAHKDLYRAFRWLSDLLASMMEEAEMWLDRAVEASAQGTHDFAEQCLQKAIACESAIKGIQISLVEFAKMVSAENPA